MRHLGRRSESGGVTLSGSLSCLVLASLALGGCGTETSHDVGSATSATGVTGEYAGALAHPVTYPNLGISLAPPPVDSAPGLAWQRTLSSCESGDAICDMNGQASVALAVATVADSGTGNPDGSLTPLMKDRLVYVMTFTGVPCVPKGPSPASNGSTPTSLAVERCTVVNLLDAESGAVLYSAEGPNP